MNLLKAEPKTIMSINSYYAEF